MHVRDAVLIPAGHQAMWLERLLRPGLAQLRRQGSTLPDDALRIVLEIQSLAIRSKAVSAAGSPEVELAEVASSWEADDDTVPTEEAARRLGVTDRRIRQMLDSGALAGTKRAGRVWAVDVASIVERQDERRGA